MAYSAPELLLVGAAQNLVLLTSADGNLSLDCEGHTEEDFPENDIYNVDPLW